MTRFQFNNRPQSASHSNLGKHRVGLAWLAIWLLVAGGFGYRHLSPESTGEALANSKLGRDPAYTKPIEQIQVGERVAFAINPTEKLDESLSFDVNPRTWRKITLKTSQHEVVLLRPVTWLNEHLAHEGSTMMLVVQELGIDEPAEVVSIWPCPSIPAGEGRIVLGTFTHIAPETICMYIEGQEEPIRCTPNHITWSVEHRNFVEAHELQPGNRVLCDDGVRQIARVEKIAEPIRVYNLEVQGQHVYQVSQLGMLVHNASPGGAPIGGDGASALSRQLQWDLRILQNARATSASGMNDRMIAASLRARYARHYEMATERIVEIMRRLATAPTSLN